ncbi:MAG: histidine phosphatase family protein [Hyphomicrobium sp.]|nr:histidine phosphatase family protein [Hyphomicrobium sp.]
MDNDHSGGRTAVPVAGRSLLNKALSVSGALVLTCFGFAAGAYCYKNSLWPLGATSSFRPADFDEFATYDADRKWAQKIRDGGYILYIRHAQREKWNDVTAFDAVEILNNARAETSSYRRAVCLTEQGVEESKLMGEVFRLASVQVDKVVSSPSCRARETAMHAFGHIDKISSALLHRTAVMKEQHQAFAIETRKIVDSLNPAPGKNDVIVAHAGTMRFDGPILIDVNETGGKLDHRDETGFVVLEKKDGKVIARHKFWSIKNLAYASLELPVNSDGAAVMDATTADAP